MRTVQDTGRANIDVVPGRMRSSFPSIKDEVFWSFYERAAKYSLVHVSGFFNVFQSINYIARNDVPGDIVECGCYLGGVGIFLGLMRAHLGFKKQIYLFDSFEGPPPNEKDVVRGRPVKSASFPNILNDVKANVESELKSLDGFEFVQGFVENTLPHPALRALCLLRLDTDFYSSTNAELRTLYPLLVRGGVLIVDDYGLFDGARRATDEWLGKIESPPLLNRIDEGVWAGVKP